MIFNLTSPFPSISIRDHTTSTMIFPQSLLLVCVLTLIRSSVSKPTHHVSPSYVPTPDGQTPDPKPAPIYLNVSSTNTTGNQTSARQNSTSHRGAGDPCGPYSSYPNYQMKQTDFETTINTCGKINTTFTHAPSIYGVQCLNANPSWDQAINLTSCASNMDSKCSSIAEGFEPASQWSWSSGVCIYIFSSILLHHWGFPPPPSATEKSADFDT